VGELTESGDASALHRSDAREPAAGLGADAPFVGRSEARGRPWAAGRPARARARLLSPGLVPAGGSEKGREEAERAGGVDGVVL
jgi:hypothetical protein